MNCRCLETVVDTFAKLAPNEKPKVHPAKPKGKKHSMHILIFKSKEPSAEGQKELLQFHSLGECESPSEKISPETKSQKKITSGLSKMDQLSPKSTQIAGNIQKKGESPSRNSNTRSFEGFEKEKLPNIQNEFNFIPNSLDFERENNEIGKTNLASDKPTHFPSPILNLRNLVQEEIKELEQESPKNPSNLYLPLHLLEFPESLGSFGSACPDLDRSLKEKSETPYQTPVFKSNRSNFSVSFGADHPSQMMFENDGSPRSKTGKKPLGDLAYRARVPKVPRFMNKKELAEEPDLGSP